MIVRFLKQGKQFHDLTNGQEYVVLGVEADDFRILNDVGRPFLYAHHLFQIVDDHEPEEWLTDFGAEGERYSYPPPLNSVGFFEDFFDDDVKAVAEFWRSVNHWLAVAV